MIISSIVTLIALSSTVQNDVKEFNRENVNSWIHRVTPRHYDSIDAKKGDRWSDKGRIYEYISDTPLVLGFSNIVIPRMDAKGDGSIFINGLVQPATDGQIVIATQSIEGVESSRYIKIIKAMNYGASAGSTVYKQPENVKHIIAKTWADEVSDGGNDTNDPIDYDLWEDDDYYLKLDSASGGVWVGWFNGIYYYVFQEKGTEICNSSNGWRLNIIDMEARSARGVDKDKNYIRQCIDMNVTTEYNPNKDIKAERKSWNNGHRTVDVTVFKSGVIRDGHLYLRTDKGTIPSITTTVSDKPDGYDWTLIGEVTFQEINSPQDLSPNFIWTGEYTKDLRVYEGRNDVPSEHHLQPDVSWTFRPSAPINMIVASTVTTETMDIQVLDGESVIGITPSVSPELIDIGIPETMMGGILNTTIDTNAEVTTTFHGNNVSVGELRGGLGVKVGRSATMYEIAPKRPKTAKRDEFGKWVKSDEPSYKTVTIKVRCETWEEMQSVVIPTMLSLHGKEVICVGVSKEDFNENKGDTNKNIVGVLLTTPFNIKEDGDGERDTYPSFEIEIESSI